LLGALGSSAQSDSAVVFSMLNRAEAYFSDSHYDSAYYYCDKAETYSKAKRYNKGLAFSWIKQAEIGLDKEQLETAEKLAEKTNLLGRQMKDSMIIAISQMQMAQAKMYAGQHDKALAIFERCTDAYFSRHPSKYAALAYNDYGYTWGLKAEYYNQAECLLKAMRIYDKINDAEDGEIAATLNNLATVYYSLNDKEKAVQYGAKSIPYREKAGDISLLALGCCNLSQMYIGVDIAEAVKYQELCIKYAEQSRDEARILHSFVTSSLIANLQKDNQKALGFELKAVSLLEKSKNDNRMLSRRYIAAAILSAELKGDSITTLNYYQKALNLSAEINRKDNIRDIYNYMSGFYKKHGNYTEAYNTYRKHIDYRDSIINENTKTNIAELETKYETEKKDKAITGLNAERRIKELQIEKQTALLSGNRLEAEKKQQEIKLLSGAQELQALRIKQQDEQLEKQLLLAKTNEQQLQLAETEKLLQQQKLKDSEATRNFILAGFVLTALLGYFLFNRYQLKRRINEQEALLAVRENIAKDLHDEVGSTLTSIKILSEVSGKNLSNDQTKTSSFLQKIAEQSAAAQQGISDIVWAVKPENDKIENLIIRMREYVAHTLESKNINTNISINEYLLRKTLSMNQRRDFLLIFKETINNIAKHAGATEVQIKLDKSGDNLSLQINDNGKGFDVLKQTSSNGLKNMKARADALHGSLTISSEFGRGSAIYLTIPAT
jgi:two-component system, NarL family, sensor histidine kinase UhpB